MDLIKSAQIGSLREDAPMAYFFPKHRVGGMRNFLDHTGSLFVHTPEGGDLKEACVIQPENARQQLIIATTRKAIISKCYPYRAPSDELVRMYEKKTGKAYTEEQVFVDVPYPAINPIAFSPESLSELMRQDQIREACDYLSLYRLTWAGNQVDIVDRTQKKPSEIRGLNADLVPVGASSYVPSDQQVRIKLLGENPEEGPEKVSSVLILTDNREELERVLKGADLREIQPLPAWEIREEYEVPQESDVLYWKGVSVVPGVYNKKNYQEDTEAGKREKWTQEFWNDMA